MTEIQTVRVTRYVGPSGELHDTQEAAERAFTRAEETAKSKAAVEERRRQVRAKAFAGLYDKEIAAQLRISKSVVALDRRAMRLPPGSDLKPDAIAAAMRLEKGLAFLKRKLEDDPEATIGSAEAAMHLQVHPTTITTHFHDPKRQTGASAFLLAEIVKWAEFDFRGRLYALRLWREEKGLPHE